MNAPKLRFKEFNDEWKITNINEQCEVFGRIGFRGYTTNDLVEKGQGAISLSPSNIKGTSLNIEKENTYISMFKYEESPEIKIYNNDIIFVKTGSSYGKVALIEGLNELATINPQLIVLKNIKCNNKVLCELLNDNRIQIQVEQTVVGGTIPTLSQAEFKKYKFYLPQENEQNKIGKLLKLLDKKIELQTKKIENLKLFKKGLINSIGKNIEIEKIPLKNILAEQNHKTIKNNEYEILSSTSKGIYLQKDYFNKQAASDNNVGYKILKKNQLVLSPQNLWMGNININSKYNIGIVSPSYKIFDINNNIDIDFFDYWIKSPKALYEYKISSEQGASIVRRNLNMDLFYEIKVDIPKGKMQNKLGKIIKLLNLKIQYNENSLQKLQELKKGLMQNMFV